MGLLSELCDRVSSEDCENYDSNEAEINRLREEIEKDQQRLDMDKTIEEKENMCATVRNNEWKEKE